jgi:kinesin family protein 11
MSSANKSTSVKVCVRLRPFNKREKKKNTLPVVTADTANNQVTVVKGLHQKAVRSTFNFDNVFSEYATQEEVFNATLLPLVEQVMLGFEATVFAYGQTGTGKTHTMEGNINLPNENGVIPRSCESIFGALEHSGKYSEFAVVVSYLEIYNEELSDLLLDTNSSKAKRLRVCEQNGKIHCMGLSEKSVTSTKEIIEVIQKAQVRRQVAETKMNKASSRSHCLFTLRVRSKEKVDDGFIEREGKLHLVDLAGSECAKTTGAGKSSTRFRESQNINKSLLTLGRVITALRDKLPRIPYRDSKLTRLLQEALGGRSQTCIIATLSPSIMSVDESLSTLTYAEQAKGITNKPVTAQVRMQALGGMGARMGMDGNSASRQTFQEMEQRMLYLQAQCQEAQGALGRKHEELEKMIHRAESAEKEVEGMKSTVEIATKKLQNAKDQNNVIRSELQEAKYKIECRDEIISARSETEQKLTEEAEILLNCLHKGVKEMNSMHEDIVNRSDKEQKIRDVTKAFFSKLMEKCDELTKQMEHFGENQNKAHKGIVNMVMSAKDNGEEWKEKMLKAVSAMKENTKSALKQNSEVTSVYNTKQTNRAESFNANVVVHTEKEFSNMVSENKQMVEGIAKTLGKAVTAHEKSIQSWAKQTFDEVCKEAESDYANLLGSSNLTRSAFVSESKEKIDANSAFLKDIAEDLSGLNGVLSKLKTMKTGLIEELKSNSSELCSKMDSGIQKLEKQHATIENAISQNDKLTQELENCNAEAFDELVCSVKTCTEKFMSLLKDEETCLSDAIKQHRETSVPFHKTIVGHVESDLQKARVEQHDEELQMISAETKALISVCNEPSMLGSAKDHLGAASKNLSTLQSHMEKSLDEQASVLVEQHELMEETLQLHIANGATETEKTHLGTIKNTEVEVKKKLEEQRELFTVALNEQKMKQEKIVSTVVSEMQRLLQAQMADMAHLFSKNITSLEEKATDMESVVEDSVNTMNAEAKAWGECGRKVEANIHSISKTNVDVRNEVESTKFTAVEKITALTDSVSQWGGCDEAAMCKVHTVIENVQKLSEHVETAHGKNQKAVANVLSNVHAWGESSAKVDSELSNIMEQVKNVESVTLANKEALTNSLNTGMTNIEKKIQESSKNRKETLNVINSQNIEASKLENEMKDSLTATSQDIMEQATNIQETIEEVISANISVSAKTAESIDAYDGLKNHLCSYEVAGNDQADKLEHSVKELHKNLEECKASLAGKLIPSYVDHTKDELSGMTKSFEKSFTNKVMSFTKSHVDDISTFLEEEKSDLDSFFKDHEIFFKSSETSIEENTDLLAAGVGEIQDKIVELCDIQSDFVENAMTKPSNDFKKIHLATVSSGIVEPSTTFCSDDVRMNENVVPVEVMKEIVYSEALSKTPADEIITKDIVFHENVVGVDHDELFDNDEVIDAPQAPSTNPPMPEPPVEEEQIVYDENIEQKPADKNSNSASSTRRAGKSGKREGLKKLNTNTPIKKRETFALGGIM